MAQKIKKEIENKILQLCKKKLKNPSKTSSSFFEPLQSYLIKRKLNRSYPHLFPLLPDTHKYNKEVKEYWKKTLGIYVNPVWHEILSKQTSNFDPRNLNQEIWDSQIRRILNPASHHIPIISDKNFFDFYINKKYFPTTVLKIVRGNFFNANNKIVSKKEAKKLLFSTSDTLFLKSSNLFQGLNAYKIHIKEHLIILNDQELSFDEFISKIGPDIIVQNVVEQHPKIAKMHPGSLNTLRIFTLRLTSGVHFMSAFIKFGADNNAADNTGNGVICGVKEDTSSIYDYGYDRKYLKSTVHPTSRLRFSNFGEIPNFNDAVDLCKMIHKNLFYHNFVAWDVSIQKSGKPLIIELNTKQDVIFYQMINGKPFLGDLTEHVLDEIKSLPS